MEWINSLNLLGLLDIFVAIATIVGCIYTVKALLPQSIKSLLEHLKAC